MADKVNPIHQEWLQFRAMAIHPNAQEPQLKEMQKAFYAGGKVMFNLMIESSDIDDDVKANFNIISLHKELERFFDKTLKDMKKNERR